MKINRCFALVIASRTFCHEILIGFDECSDQRSWERSKPVFPVEISRDRAQDVVQEILLGVNRGSIAVVPIKQLQPNDRAKKPGMRHAYPVLEAEGHIFHLLYNNSINWQAFVYR